MRTKRLLGLLIVLAVLVPAWIYLAPSAVGGTASYVSTLGSSMEPKLHQGDLVMVRRADQYRVGDVVAYHSQHLHAVVLHRIVALEGDRFVTKGDNNGWTDSDHPTADQIVGRMTFVVPGFGKALRYASSPITIAIAAGLVLLPVFGFSFGRRRRRRRGAPPEDRRAAGRPDAAVVGSPGDPRRLQWMVGAGALVVLVVGAIAWTRPTQETEVRRVTYTNHGSLSYSAVAPGAGPVYERNEAATGQPVYLSLAEKVKMRFAYRFDTAAPTSVSGTIGLDAVLRGPDGWTRATIIQDSHSFTGPEASASGTLDLAALTRMIRQVAALTGVERDSYVVSVVPQVQLHGTVGGKTLDVVFEPQIDFQLDSLELQMASTAGGPTGQAPDDPLAPATGGMVSIPTKSPNDLSVLGLTAQVEPLRAVSAAGAALVLLGLMILAVRGRRSRRVGKHAQIQARYGHWLVPVDATELAGKATVDVESMESLVRLATHYGHVILHEVRDGVHSYLIQENGLTYRYRVTGADGNGGGPRVPAPDTLEKR